MKFRWKWYEVYALLMLICMDGLLFVFTTTLFAEKLQKGLLISGAALTIMAMSTWVFIRAKCSGRFENTLSRLSIQTGLALLTLFIALLFVPTTKQTGSAEYGSTEIKGKQERYDAREQPGSDLYVKMSQAVTGDVLTLTIYDICVGKISHRVERDGKAGSQKIEVTNPSVLTRHIKDQARALGARIVGITELTPEFVFTHDPAGTPIRLDHRTAIVMGMDLNYMLAAPSAPLPWEDLYSSIPEELAAALAGKMVKSNRKISPETLAAVKETMRFFSEGGKTAVELARFIRGLGYSARAHYQRWSEVQIVPLTVKAGLGELSRNGMTVSRTMGPRGSFAVVTTDLPLVPDQPQTHGIKEFCDICKKCARYCPVQAIPFGRAQVVRGVLKWPLDGEKCANYLVTNPKCMACIGSCPFNKPDYWIHRAAAFMASRRSALTNWLLLKMDDLLGYGEMAAEPPQARSGLP